MPFSQQEITSFRQWSDRVFSFTTTRPEAFDFRNGEFVMLGLRPAGKLIPRAYSITSTNRDDHLEFLGIRVPDGPLTSHLPRVGAGAPIWINTKSTGSLTLEHIRPGRHLYLLATGTGLAPFLSLIRAGEVFRCFQRVILVHTVRARHDLAYHDELWSRTNENFRYLPTVTREPFATDRRGAELFRDGELAAILDLPPADPDEDRVMVCGNPDMNREMTEYLKDRGWTRVDYRGAGQFAVELAVVQQS